MSQALRITLHGEPGEIGADAVHAALGATLALAREATSVIGADGVWVIDELGTGSAVLSIKNPAAPGAVELVTAGFATLEVAPRVPEQWTQSMVAHARRLSRLVGRRGVTGVDISTTTTSPKALTGSVAAHADSALAVRESSSGSIVGTVDMWESRRGRTVGLTLDSGETVRASYPSHLAGRIVNEAIDQRIVISGEIRRNGAGQRVEVVIHDFEAAPRTLPMDVTQLAGLYGDLGRGGVTVADVLEHRE